MRHPKCLQCYTYTFHEFRIKSDLCDKNTFCGQTELWIDNEQHGCTSTVTWTGHCSNSINCPVTVSRISGSNVSFSHSYKERLSCLAVKPATLYSKYLTRTGTSDFYSLTLIYCLSWSMTLVFISSIAVVPNVFCSGSCTFSLGCCPVVGTTGKLALKKALLSARIRPLKWRLWLWKLLDGFVVFPIFVGRPNTGQLRLQVSKEMTGYWYIR